MAEFPDLGVHCSLKECGKLDFAPFLCKLCREFYCLDHRFSHNCQPDENQVLGVLKSESGRFKQFLCSMTGCFTLEWSKMLCSQCDSHFCMQHRLCEDHHCKGVSRTYVEQKNKVDHPTTSSEVVIKAPKKSVDPAQQTRADKIAAMRLKANNTFNIPQQEALIIFVNGQNFDRFPCMVSKTWTVNRCKTMFLEKCGRKSEDTNVLTLYVEGDDRKLFPLILDYKAEQCLRDLQDVHLLEHNASSSS